MRGSLDLAPGGTLALDLDGEQLRAGTLAWTQLTGRLAGTREDHRLTLDAQGSPLGLSLYLAGGLGEEWQWRGQIADLRLAAGELGSWALTAPAALALAADGTTLEDLCLTHDSAELCTQVRAGAGEAAGTLQLRQLPGRFFEPWLPPDVAIDTLLASTVEWRLGGDGAVTLDALIEATQSGERCKLLNCACDKNKLSVSATALLWASKSRAD